MGGKTKSSTVTDTSTDVSTVTNTTVGDVGISGADIVELQAVIQQGQNINSQIVADAAFQGARDTVRESNAETLPAVGGSSGLPSLPVMIAVALGAIGLIALAG